MAFIEPVALTGNLVELRPLDAGDHDELVEAAGDGELWTLFYTGVPRPEGMRTAIDQWLAKPNSCC